VIIVKKLSKKLIVVIVLPAIFLLAIFAILFFHVIAKNSNHAHIISHSEYSLPPLPVHFPNPYFPEADSGVVKKYTKDHENSLVFEYELKGKYNSRQEIYQELANLDECFRMISRKVWKVEPSDLHELIEHNSETYDTMVAQLTLCLDDFPINDEEIFYKKVNALDMYIDSYYSDCSIAVVNNTLTDSFVSGLLASYERIYKAKEDFEAKKITIDEALDRLGIRLDSNGDRIYSY
jgi:hypothetical protein